MAVPVQRIGRKVFIHFGEQAASFSVRPAPDTPDLASTIKSGWIIPAFAAGASARVEQWDNSLDWRLSVSHDILSVQFGIP
jgi:hypothetical protein